MKTNGLTDVRKIPQNINNHLSRHLDMENNKITYTK